MLQCVGDMERVHFRLHIGKCGEASLLQLAVAPLLALRHGNDLAEILLLHIQCALDQIAEVVDQIGVIALDHRFIGNRAVACKRHFGKRIVAHAVHREMLRQLICIDDVALGFRHLVCSEVEPRVTEHLLGQGQIKRH